MNLSIVTLCHNYLDYTKQCIEAVIEHCGFLQKDWEYFLINNGSTDGTKEYLDKLKRQYSNIKVIHLDKNEGCSARNHGLLNASGRCLMTIDNDMVVGKLAIKKMYYELENKKQVGAISFTGTNYVTEWNDLLKESSWYYVDCLPTACFAVRKKIINLTGGIDEMFNPMYGGDADLSFKIKQCGYKLYKTPINVLNLMADTKLDVLGGKEGVEKNRKDHWEKLINKWDGEKDKLFEVYQNPVLRRLLLDEKI